MRFLTVSHPRDEWLRDFVPTLEAIKLQNVDIFTFWQRFPDVTPHYDYRMEWDNVAVLEVKSFEDWWERVGKKTRNMVRKAEKSGVKVRIVEPNNEFFDGVTRIFNEKPIRQGKRFPHYGKTLIDVKKGYANCLDQTQNTFIGAYHESELIGFIHLIHTDKYSIMSNILCFEKHLDKAPMNALIAKAVKICSEMGVKYLIYEKMGGGSLGEFKRHNGFVKRLVPRYYIPLTLKGKVGLALNLHHGWRGLIPERLKPTLRVMRGWFYEKLATC